MRGHIKKTVARRLLRRTRRKIFRKIKERAPVLKQIRGLVRARVQKLARFRHTKAAASRLGDSTRKIARAGSLRYDTVAYGKQLGRLWKFRYLSVLGGLRKYFFLKTIRSRERDVSRRFFRKKKRRIPESPARPSIKNMDSVFNKDSISKLRGIDDEVSVDDVETKSADAVLKLWTDKQPKTLWSATRKRVTWSDKDFRKYSALYRHIRVRKLNRKTKLFDAELYKARRIIGSLRPDRNHRDYFSYGHRYNYWVFRLARRVRRKRRYALFKKLVTRRTVVLKAGSVQSLQYGRLRGGVARHMARWYKLLAGKKFSSCAVGVLTASYRHTRGAFNTAAPYGSSSTRRAQLQKALIFGKLLDGVPTATDVFDPSSSSYYSMIRASRGLASSREKSASSSKKEIVNYGVSGAALSLSKLSESVDASEASDRAVYLSAALTETALLKNFVAGNMTTGSASTDSDALKGLTNKVYSAGMAAAYSAIDAARKYGSAGSRHGAFVTKLGVGKFRANHYTARSLKYRRQYSYSYVSRWSEAIRQKILARNRVEFYYKSEAITIAPRMFGVYNYRTATIGKFFQESFGSMFVYVYLYGSYVDKLLGNSAAAKIKTFVLHEESADGQYTKEFNSRIAGFIEVLAKGLEIKRNKNKPDYCYYLNARLIGDEVVELDRRDAPGDFDILSLWELVNYHTLGCCLEVYKIVNALICASASR